MVANPGKFQILFMIENKIVKSRDEVKLLDITIEISCLSLHIMKTYAAQQVTASHDYVRL